MALKIPTSLLQALEGNGRITASQFHSLSTLSAQKLAAQLQTERITPMAMAMAMAEQNGLPLLDLSAVDAGKLPVKCLSQKLATTHFALPLLHQDKRLVIAMADPTNGHALQEIRSHTGAHIEPLVAEYDKLSALILKLYSGAGPDSSVISDPMLKESSPKLLNFEHVDGQESSVVKLIQTILEEGLRLGASDIHFEPYEKMYRVRFRVDGSLQEVATPPLLLKEKIASRLKIISRMNIAEKRIPQDGRMILQLDDKNAIAFRVNSLPTVYGEKIVLRALSTSATALDINALGYGETQQKLILQAIERPFGMILVTGPTGSGKTVSLYSCLSILNKPGINISTVEDPAEISLEGVNQVSVDEKAGMTFATALRAFLRQDPDVIMVGEIRDLETAEISIKAAQTGHLVLSTLHTNDAPATLERLHNMGIPTYNIAASVILITSQRLIKRLCHCKKQVHIQTDALLEAGFHEEDLDEDWELFAPQGCPQCQGTGYKGRIGLFQVMPITDGIARLILGNAGSRAIAEQAALEGFSDLRSSGLIKVRQGLTSLDEVIGATFE